MDKLEYKITEPHSPDALVRGTLADLVLDAYLISRCGLIPPFVVLKDQFRSGGGDAGMSPGCIWEPFELTESEYLDMVGQLESVTSEDLTLRHRNPEIIGEIRPDYAGENAKNWREWRDSLVYRGLLLGSPSVNAKR